MTAYGRRMIEHTRLVVEREFGSTGGGHGYGPDVEAKVTSPAKSGYRIY